MQEASKTFWAITGLGWGTADTAEEAATVYLNYQRGNYPHLSEAELAESWGFVWLPPAEAEGFDLTLGGRLYFNVGGERVEAEAAWKVAEIGNVPEQFSLDIEAGE